MMVKTKGRRIVYSDNLRSTVGQTMKKKKNGNTMTNDTSSNFYK